MGEYRLYRFCLSGEYALYSHILQHVVNFIILPGSRGHAALVARPDRKETRLKNFDFLLDICTPRLEYLWSKLFRM